ncbi:hypothetical protein DFH09DRAFT_1079809 [Mycena vulgaris]|nr:hypothetical protein DFH09DRAFT_1079809 [Mycena vulgaris]
MSSLRALAVAQDKAFKYEALHHDASQPVRAPLQRWIKKYRPPMQPITLPQPTAPPRQSFYELKRAELVARKARVDALMALRARGEKEAHLRWPPFRQSREEQQKRQRAADGKHRADEEARLEAARAAFERKEERAAADARVATPTPTRAQLIQLSYSVCSLICPVLYKDISVGDAAGRLIRSLAHEPRLPPMVQYLEFSGSMCAYINNTEWEFVLPAMCNLRQLVIAHNVPLESRILPFITFKLRVFESHCRVYGPWAEFLATQSGLEQVVFHSDLFGPVPLLPLLRSVQGCPEDVSRFSRRHSLEDAWFSLGHPWGRRTLSRSDLRWFNLSPSQLLTLRIMAPQLLLLMYSTPAMLKTPRHLTLDEDLAWYRFTPQTVLARAARALAEYTPLLQSLTLIAFSGMGERGLHPSLDVSQAPIFATALAPFCASAKLATFHFCGVDHCGTWRNWGREGEEVVYAELEEHGPWDLDPHAFNFDSFFVEFSKTTPMFKPNAEAKPSVEISDIESGHRRPPCLTLPISPTVLDSPNLARSTQPKHQSMADGDMTFTAFLQEQRLSRAATRIRGRRRRSELPPPRIQDFPIVRQRSLPTPAETRKRYSVDKDAPYEEGWQTAIQDLVAWTEAVKGQFEQPQVPHTTWGDSEGDLAEGLNSPSLSIQDLSVQDFLPGQTNGEGIERGWHEALRSQEAVERNISIDLGDTPPELMVISDKENGADSDIDMPATAGGAATAAATTLLADENASQWANVLRLSMATMREGQQQSWLLEIQQQERLTDGRGVAALARFTNTRHRLLSRGQHRRADEGSD